MNRNVNSISGRLSLRPPQRESLERLARVTEIIALEKGADPNEALARIRGEFPSVTDFEREFPSLCFHLATGVGKTRLMGAFISYLFLEKAIRHYFVLAPSLTIYNKLIADFTPNTPKYVFQGIGAFASNLPQVVTGDNYNTQGSVSSKYQLTLYSSVQINIFNISKINTEVRGGASPRIKKLSEYLGESYFEYLAGLNDLVLIMDESHRYRASAGVRAINDLKPVIGLELTATPFTEAAGRQVHFKNVIYSYPLANALADGYVKEPMVATRENFRPQDYNVDELDRIKLQDGVRVHENTKVELEVFARQNDRRVVKPFIMVVARDVEHADRLVAMIKAPGFFEGRYADRVMTINSSQTGQERDENVERLVHVEQPEDTTEIVVHVNMLKEGWDVTNLYTIVPLRAANAKTLVEQSVGRGLRLPYGKRVGVPAVDRLTIIAHDKFQEIVDEARNPNSIIKLHAFVDEIVGSGPKQVVTVEPAVLRTIESPQSVGGVQQTIAFETPAERQIARVTVQSLPRFERLKSSFELLKPEIQAELVQAVEEQCRVDQALNLGEEVDVRAVVRRASELYIERSIDIPRIIVVPKGEVSFGYHPFRLDLRDVRLQPVAQDILLQSLQTEQRSRLVPDQETLTEPRLEDYIVSLLIDFDDICYDQQADLIYDLASQVVAHLHTYLPNDDDVSNVVRYHRRQLANLIHAQMQSHSWQTSQGYDVNVSKGFITLRNNNYSAATGETVRDYRQPVEERLYIRGMRFGGFRRCLYPEQKFDSDSERRFAVICERDEDILKWFKPAKGQLQIDYRNGKPYEPDFVVETKTAKLLVEPKRASEMEDSEVIDKANAASTWCIHASEHEKAVSGKPWSYLLIPHDAIAENASLAGLIAAFRYSPSK